MTRLSKKKTYTTKVGLKYALKKGIVGWLVTGYWLTYKKYHV